MKRRDVVIGMPFAAVALAARGAIGDDTREKGGMYGLIGKMLAKPGQRDALAAILLEATGAMPGCLSYIIASDSTDADALWITEVWIDEASHKGSLSLPAVQAAIGRARPIIAGFGDRFVTTPLGGVGLVAK